MILPICCEVFREKFGIFLKYSTFQYKYLWISLKNAILVVRRHSKGTLSMIVFDRIVYLAIKPG